MFEKQFGEMSFERKTNMLTEQEIEQRAKELFEEGWRLYNWGAALTDTFEEINLKRPDGEWCGRWADGVNRHTEEVYEILGVENTRDGNEDEILFRLSEMTEAEENK